MEEKTLSEGQNITVQSKNRKTREFDTFVSLEHSTNCTDGSSIIAELSKDDIVDDAGHIVESNDTYQNTDSWFKKIKKQCTSTFRKRNPIVNVFLSLFLIFAILLSLYPVLNILCMLLLMPIIGTDIKQWCFVIPLAIVSLFWMFYVYQFIVVNKKNAFMTAFIGSTLVWHFYIFMLLIIATPEYDTYEELVDSAFVEYSFLFVWPLILSIIVNALIYGITYRIMQIKKHGITAWALLDVAQYEKRSKLQKVILTITIIIWILSIMGFIDVYCKDCIEKFA